MTRPHPLQGHPDLREVSVPVATMWTSAAAPRPGLDEAALADLPDMARWTAALDAEGTADRRLGLHGRTLTQLLLGEGVLVLERHGEWSQVVALLQRSKGHAQGYPGWVRSAHLGAPVAAAEGPTAFVTVPRTSVRLDAGGELEVSCGTGFWVDPDGAPDAEHVSVLLPGDRRGTVPRSAVRLSDKQAAPSASADAVLDSARQFLGLRYLWGGTSAWGLDCSGLVHLTFRTHGVRLPRDASDQAAHPPGLTPVALDAVRAGDLYFFAGPGRPVTHVGFATAGLGDDGARPMLHAPEGGGLIEERPMSPERAATLVSAARPMVYDTVA